MSDNKEFEKLQKDNKQLMKNIETLKKQIDALKETNRRLNKRANKEDSYWQSRAMKAEHLAKMWSDSWLNEFKRLNNTFDELKEIYTLIYEYKHKVTPKYHSVSNICVSGEAIPDKVYANVIINNQFSHSERVVDAVKNFLDDYS